MNALTLGVEEEYMVIDPKTMELSSNTSALLEEASFAHGDNMKAEFHAAVVEIVTDVCSSVDELKVELLKHRKAVVELADKHGLLIAAGGTHPFTHWRSVDLTAGTRYELLLDRMQDLARANLIYGMHCHVGIEDPEARIHVMNAARYYLPHLLALSASSPFWQGKNTGHRSIRTHIFRRFPRTGIPDSFEDEGEYNRFVELLVRTGCIENAKMIYWDIRPHAFFPTVEFRGCDTPTRINESLAIVALLQAIVSRLLRLYEEDLSHRQFRRALLAENIYRAARYGLDGKIIDFGRATEICMKEAIRRLCEKLRPEFEALGSVKYIGVIEDILQHGNSAQRQLQRFESGATLPEVVEQLVAETREGLD